MAKLYPPQLEGTLPAFYKTYDERDENLVKSCTINIPFGINRAVNIKTIKNIALRLRTTSTNTYLIADCPSTNYDEERHIASFKFNYDPEDENTDLTATLINEGQYYRAQLAFVDMDDTVGYYSTVGIIKCITQPSVRIDGYEKNEVNTIISDSFMGVYEQNTRFGDSTEKAYSYQFDLFDNLGNLITSSGEQLHDVTQDTFSDTSNDIWRIYQDLPIGEIYKLRYTVTTLNGLTLSTVDYKVMKAVSIEPEYNIKIHADANYDDGYIDIYLSGETTEKSRTENYYAIGTDFIYDDTITYYTLNEDLEYIEFTGSYSDWLSLRGANKLYMQEISVINGEIVCTGNYLITRANSLDDYFEWLEITRFTMSAAYPSEFHFYDYTVEQGVRYKYAIQQYNVHDLYSNKIYQTDANGVENTVMADFEDMFLSDGIRQLKVRFNPKVTSFKNTIPEQKIETIGSKYPFIFRNGSVCYKEFPIGGLISFQMDDALLFLNDDEQRQAGILDYNYVRINTGADNYRHVNVFDNTNYKKTQTLKIPVYHYEDLNKPKDQRRILYYRYVTTDYKPNTNKLPQSDVSETYDNISNGLVTGRQTSDEPNGIRLDRNLTSENMMGERYFKLKVLDWLTDGKVKLFRSPAEGNYLVRLLNVQLTPQDPLGRMLHQFTCTGYEVDVLNYTTLVNFGIVVPSVTTNYETQWASVDVNQILNENKDKPNEFIKISPDGTQIEGITIQDFAPGDQIKLVYDSGPDGIFTIGVTGSLELNNDDRTIIEVWIKPNPETSEYDDFSRTFFYQTTNMQLTKFDAVSDVSTYTVVSEQFIGPKENLLEPYNLRDHVYGERNEDGVVLHPYKYTEAYDHVYADLIAHQRFTYMLNETTEKIQGYKIDILHVHKKGVIPIYCYYDDTISYFGPNNWQLDGLFGVTPFNIPYVNSTNIKKFVNSRGAINYVSEVITQDDYGRFIRSKGINIEDIMTVFEEAGVIFNVYDLLEPYYYDANANDWIPFRELAFSIVNSGSEWSERSKYYTKINQSYQFFDAQAYLDEYTEEERATLATAEAHLEHLLNSEEEVEAERIEEARAAIASAKRTLSQRQQIIWSDLINREEIWLYSPSAPGYYDLYRHIWIDANEQYDPTFSINDPDVFPEKDEYGYDIDTPEFVGDNNISLRETEEMTLYNLGQIPHIRLGNGVVAEITAQIRVVDYEIEETDPATKEAKEEYLKARKLLNDLLDLAMLHASELADAEVEAEQLIKKIQEVEDQINAYSGNSTATAGVMEVAEKRLIDQKKKLWYTLEQQLEDILDILQKQSVYLDIEGNIEVDALTSYDYDDNMASIQNFADKELTDNNELYLYNNPETEEETVEINQMLQTFKIISDAYIYYDEQYKNIMEAQQAIINQCNDRLTAYSAQRGTIVGGYLEDYDDDNPPPENTLVYVEYQLAKIDAAIEAEYNKVVEKKSDLITQLLEEVLLEEGKTLTNLTDQYIIDNADELILLIDSYLSSRRGDLDDLKEKFYKKVTHLIFILDKDDEVALKDVLMDNISLPSGYEEQLQDIEDLFENTLLNISRKLIGQFEVDPASVPDNDPNYVEPTPSFTNSTGVAKLIIFLRALLAQEKAKTEKQQDKEAISALTTWIEYLITNKDSYKYSVPHYYRNNNASVDDDVKVRGLKNELTAIQNQLQGLGVPVIFNSNYECTNFDSVYSELDSLNGTVYDEGNGYQRIIDYSIQLNLMRHYRDLYQELIETIEKAASNLSFAKSNIYSAIYYLENNLSDEPEPLTHTIDLEQIQETIDTYIGKVAKLNLGTDANYTKKADVAAAYAAAKQAYNDVYNSDSNNHNYIFYNATGTTHPYTLQLHNILKQYYQEPDTSKDNEGFTTYAYPSPDYNITLLNKFGKYEALIAAYKGAYDLYAIELATQISTLESQKAILVAITKDPGYIERTYAELCQDEGAENYNQFVEQVNAIKENYIEQTTEQINPSLTPINQTVYDFLNLTEDSSADEKATALLNLLIDEYNRTSANSVMSYLNEYLKGKGEEEISSSTESKVNTIVQRLKNAEATYQTRLQELTRKKETYLDEQNKYNAQIEEIEVIVKATEQNRQHAQELYDEAADHRLYASQTVAQQDGEALINRIAANEKHQNNISLTRRYTNWLEGTQNALLTQIGQIFSNVEKSSEYADMLKAFINAYEDEAFEFMHWYDALPIDMHEGYFGNDGIDWLYSRPSEYWLSSYEKILFLNEEPFNTSQLAALTSGNDATRTAEYQKQKKHLTDLLLLNTSTQNNATLIELGVLCQIVEDNNDENVFNKYKYRLVRLGYEADDKWYPIPYEITDGEYTNPLFTDAEGHGICPCSDTLFLLRKPDELSEESNTVFSDQEFRYISVADQDHSGIYQKNPYATAYYTYDSVKGKMVDVFGKPISEVTAAEFHTAADASVRASKPIKWLTANMPITVSAQLHTNLFTDFTYDTDFVQINEINLENAMTVNAELLTIVPTYYTYYDKVLGLIIHDVKNNEEYGSWYALQEYDQLIWQTISSYFTTCAYYNILIQQAYTADHASYYANYAQLAEYQEELERWITIKNECEIVLANYNAQGVSNEDKKKQQLIILLDSALDEIEYLNNEITRLQHILEEFLLTNTSFKEFLAYQQMIPNIYSQLSSYLTAFNKNYNIYASKVQHYLTLIFNNEPYGKFIDQTVLQHEELLHINDNNTNMYNFGLAYALDAYKNNYNNDDPINFTDITDKVNEINSFLNENYDFMYPVDRLIPIDPLEEPFNLTYRYYILNEQGEYQHTTAINQETYENYTNLYAIKDSQYHIDDGRVYFIKQEDGSFVKYRKINDTTWYEDLLTLDLWYTYYPSLIDFASIENYKCINDPNDKYDPTIQYYTLNGGKYEPTLVTPETFTNTGVYYVITGNGGINNFLAQLTNGSPYIQKIKDNYNGTYALYESLLAQTLGDTTTLNNLRNLLTAYQVRQKELEEILKYKTTDSIDTEQLILDIYDKLTHYLVTLTNAYIELVERSYGVV